MAESRYSSPAYFASRLKECLSEASIFDFGVSSKLNGRDMEGIRFSIAGLECVVKFEQRGPESWVVHELLNGEGGVQQSYPQRFVPETDAVGRVSNESMREAISGFLKKNFRDYGKSLQSKTTEQTK